MSCSVIIPAFNCQSTIGSCLMALYEQNIDDFEVIVVDDGSIDNTKNMCNKLVEVVKDKFSLSVLSQENSGPAKARNIGSKVAKNSILVFTDSDCVPDHKWLEEMIKPFEDSSIAGVSGTYRTENSESLIARYVGYEIAIRHKKMEHMQKIDFVGTFSAAYRRELFLSLRGFDENYPNASGEDVDFSFRVSKEGNKIIFNKNAIVGHYHPESLRKYLKQKYVRGKSSIKLYFSNMDKVSKGDSYTPRSLLFQIILCTILPFLYVLFITDYLNLNVLLSFITILGLSLFYNSVQIAFFEYKFLLLAPIILLLRNYAFIMGILHESINLIFYSRNH